MKSQDEIVAARNRDWRELETILSRNVPFAELDAYTISRAAALYRSLSNDLILCRVRATPDLVAYLDSLASRAHSALYGAEPVRMPAILKLFTHEFPQAFRRNIWFFAAASALFCIPCIIGVLVALYVPDAASTILPRSALDQMSEMYSGGFDKGRSEGTDSMMAGFYVYNNIGIALRCFATGFLCGLGSVFFLIYNGLHIGVVAGWVTASGFGHNIGTFMCGHGPFELTAIVISGQAGLRLGHSFIVTHGRTRIGSLREAAPDLARLVGGAAMMLLIAAGIEGFWSPSALPAPVKWGASVLFSLLVAAYLAFAGRVSARSNP